MPKPLFTNSVFAKTTTSNTPTQNKKDLNMNTSTATLNTKPSNDERPRFAIGHMSMPAGDVVSLTRFYGRLGMRVVVESPNFAILEIRGGTHLILQPGPAGQGELDLMVDDIDDTRDAFIAEGVQVSRITRGNPHDRFATTDPEGNRLSVSSSHAMGPV